MGLPRGVLYLLARMKSRGRLPGPLLTLGEQDIYANYEDLQAIAASLKLPWRPLAPKERRPAAGVFVRANRLDAHGFLHAETVFRLLGFPGVDSLDAASVEGAKLIHDLNEPIPTDWHGRYGTVIDGGTLEHIFDVRTALGNVARLARVGGDVVHINPVANWINHGFYQFSPCMLFDYYAANGFEPGEAYFVTLDAIERGQPVRAAYHEAYVHCHRRTYVCNVSQPVLFVASFTKREEVLPARVPVQGKYAERLQSSQRPHAKSELAKTEPGAVALVGQGSP